MAHLRPVPNTPATTPERSWKASAANIGSWLAAGVVSAVLWRSSPPLISILVVVACTVTITNLGKIAAERIDGQATEPLRWELGFYVACPAALTAAAFFLGGPTVEALFRFTGHLMTY